ncbi:MAG TPA: ABC transporter ATP-binding protein [Candidatus Dojkabacteria bacterium]|nr:ABC transporter ATP-binding protein [Candidatus Dojkabacteria bacterium]
MDIKKYSRKFRILFKIIRYIYSLNPFNAISRDFLFIVSIGLQMYVITVGGQFIDATADILKNWNTFSLQSYFVTDSFYFLALGLSLWLIVMLIGNLRGHLYDRINQNTLWHMQGELLNVISRTNLEDIESKEFRDLLTFVPNFSYGNVIASYYEFSEAIKGLFTAVTSVSFIWVIMGPSSLIVMLFAVAENVVSHYYRNKRKTFYNGQVENFKTIDYLQNLMTRIQFFPELRVDNTFSPLKDKYSERTRNYVDGYLHIWAHDTIDTSLASVVDNILVCGYIIYVLFVSIMKRLTIGHFKAIYDYVFSIYGNTSAFLTSVLKISSYVDYSEKYFDYIEYKGFGDLAHGELELSEGTPKLALKNVNFRYPENKENTLSNLNVEFNPGEKILIIGGDGSGKSSFIKLLCGLYKIDEGDYLINGIDIRELQRGELKKHISVLFQDFIDYNFSVKENITLTKLHKNLDLKLYDDVKKICDIDRILEKENIDDDQLLGKYISGGKELSPGYWQRLALARMLYRNRDIFIMDEPFTYIDQFSRKAILKRVLDFIGKDKTVIYITQDDHFLEFFDKAYHLKNGRLHKYIKGS